MCCESCRECQDAQQGCLARYVLPFGCDESLGAACRLILPEEQRAACSALDATLVKQSCCSTCEPSLHNFFTHECFQHVNIRRARSPEWKRVQDEFTDLNCKLDAARALVDELDAQPAECRDNLCNMWFLQYAPACGCLGSVNALANVLAERCNLQISSSEADLQARCRPDASIVGQVRHRKVFVEEVLHSIPVYSETSDPGSRTGGAADGISMNATSVGEDGNPGDGVSGTSSGAAKVSSTAFIFALKKRYSSLFGLITNFRESAREEAYAVTYDLEIGPATPGFLAELVHPWVSQAVEWVSRGEYRNMEAEAICAFTLFVVEGGGGAVSFESPGMVRSSKRFSATMSAALAWTAVAAQGQVPTGMLESAQIVAVRKDLFVLTGGLSGGKWHCVQQATSAEAVAAEEATLLAAGVEEAPGRMRPSSRCQHAVCAVGADQVFLFGGCSDWDSGAKLGDLWVFNAAEARSGRGVVQADDSGWTQLRPRGKWPSARSGHALVFVEPDSICVWGGVQADGTHGDTLYGGAPLGAVNLHFFQGPHDSSVHVLHTTDDTPLFVPPQVAEEDKLLEMGKIGLGVASLNDIESGAGLQGAHRELEKVRGRLVDLRGLLVKTEQEAKDVRAEYRNEEQRQQAHKEMLEHLSRDLEQLSAELGYLRQRNGVLCNIAHWQQQLRVGQESVAFALKNAFYGCEALMLHREFGDKMAEALGEPGSATDAGNAAARDQGDEATGRDSGDATNAASKTAKTVVGSAPELGPKAQQALAQAAEEALDEEAELRKEEEDERMYQELAKTHRMSLARVPKVMEVVSSREAQIKELIGKLKMELGLVDDQRALQEKALGIAEGSSGSAGRSRSPLRISLDDHLGGPSSCTEKGTPFSERGGISEGPSMVLEGQTEVLLDEALG
eukprot:gene326-127_t